MLTPRRLVWILAAVLGTPVALYGLAWAFVVPSSDDYQHRLVFDAKAWREKSADASDDWPTRLRMVDSLMDRRVLDGRTQLQVVELLGPTDDTLKWRDWDLVYHLGPERKSLFRIDSEWLVIRLDARRTVVSYPAKYDGKDHPATGSSPFGDTLAITRVNPNTVRIVSKLAGKQTIVQTIVVAADGKTRTTTAKGTDGKGQPVDSMSFYEKQ